MCISRCYVCCKTYPVNVEWCSCEKWSPCNAQGYCSSPCVIKGIQPEFTLRDVPTEEEVEDALKDPNVTWNTDQYTTQDTIDALSSEMASTSMDNNNNNSSSSTPPREETDEEWMNRMIDTIILLLPCSVCKKQPVVYFSRRSKLHQNKSRICPSCKEVKKKDT